MKSLTVRLVGGLGFLGATGTAVAGVWYTNQPKDVKSKLVSEGLTLVGDSSRAWRAVFLTHKEDVEFIKFSGAVANQSSNTEGSKIASACLLALKVETNSLEYDSNLEKARKYCTVPKSMTVEAKILFSDKEPSSADKDWKDSFVLNKGDNTFMEKIKSANVGSSLDTSTSVDNAHSLVKKFCEALKVKPADSSSVDDYEKYCLQTPKNVLDLYEKQGHKFVGENGWGSKFDSIKNGDDSLFKEIVSDSSLSSTSKGEQGGPKLKEWCDKEKVKEINAVSVLAKVKSRCFN